MVIPFQFFSLSRQNIILFKFLYMTTVFYIINMYKKNHFLHFIENTLFEENIIITTNIQMTSLTIYNTYMNII